DRGRRRGGSPPGGNRGAEPRAGTGAGIVPSAGWTDRAGCRESGAGGGTAVLAADPADSGSAAWPAPPGPGARHRGDSPIADTDAVPRLGPAAANGCPGGVPRPDRRRPTGRAGDGGQRVAPRPRPGDRDGGAAGRGGNRARRGRGRDGPVAYGRAVQLRVSSATGSRTA